MVGVVVGEQIKIEIMTVTTGGRTYVDVMDIISLLLKFGHTKLAQVFANLKPSETP